MSEKVYFSKVEFKEYIGYRLNSILLLNLMDGSLAYQVYKAERKIHAPAIVGIETKEFMGHTWESDIRKPAMRMKNEKTGFK